MTFKTRMLEENWKNYAKGAALGGVGMMLGDHFGIGGIDNFNDEMQSAAKEGVGNYWDTAIGKAQTGLDSLKSNSPLDTAVQKVHADHATPPAAPVQSAVSTDTMSTYSPGAVSTPGRESFSDAFANRYSSLNSRQ